MRIRHPTNPGMRLGMPMTAWPEADQAAWHYAFTTPGSPFDDHGVGVDMRLGTKDAFATCYARWLLWIKQHDPAALDILPGARATEARVIAYLYDLRKEITPLGVLNYATRLRSVLGFIAPKYDWEFFKVPIDNLAYHASQVPKKRLDLVPTDLLFAFGFEVMESASADRALTDIKRAELFRDGLMISFLAARPLRLDNMTELELESQLYTEGEGYAVVLPPTVTKTHSEVEFPLPEVLTVPMRDYLTDYRPILGAGPFGVEAGYADQARFVWLAKSGRQYPSDSFAAMLTARILARFNKAMTTHNFRHSAATTIAENQPEEYRIIRLILGHSTMATAEKYYIRAKGRQAARLYQDHLDGLREALANLTIEADDDHDVLEDDLCAR